MGAYRGRQDRQGCRPRHHHPVSPGARVRRPHCPVFVRFKEGKKPTEEQIKAQELDLPSAPKQFIHYFEEPDRPQARTDRELEGGMAISAGRLRPDSQYDYKFVGLSHNTLRGAAGGGVLLAELLCAEGYIDHK